MEEIIIFKRSVLENTFSSFFEEFKNERIEFQVEFINELKKENLDIFFFLTLKRYGVLEELNRMIIKPLKQEFLLEKGRDGFYKNQFYQVLKKAHFPLLLLKGWQLRESINHELYKRSCDVDILVHEKDFTNTIKLLENEFNFFSKPQYIAYGQNCLLNENSMCIDLHKILIAKQSFDSIFNLKAKELFKEASLKKDADSEYFVFNYEMELIHLCIHFLFHHEGYGFILIYELKCYLVENFSRINTENLLKIAKKHKSLSVVLFCFMIIRDLCIVPSNTKQWTDRFIEKNDYNLRVDRIFSRSFNKKMFYKDMGISKSEIRRLVLNNLKKKISYLRGSIEFSIYCNALFIKNKFS